MRILWIGNSFTYYNDLPAIFESLVKNEGREVHTLSITKGGWFLHRHADPKDEMGAKVAEALKEEWDVVVLQEQSFQPIRDPEDYKVSATSLINKCGKAKVFLYQSWSYEDGSEKLAGTFLSFEQMHNGLSKSVHNVAAALGARIAPVGDALFVCCKEHPEIPLYCSDHYHPSIFLSFLAALTFYKSIYGEMPKKNLLPDGVDKESAAILKNIAASIGE